MTPAEYNLLIGLLSAVVLVLPFTGKVYDGRRRIINRIQVKGWIIIICFFSALLVTYLKDVDAELEENRKELLIQQGQAKSDSIVKSGRLEVIKELAKYNLGLENKQNTVIKLIRDSAKRIVNINSSVLPSLSINKITLEKVSYPDHLYQIELICTNNNAYKINLKLSTISEGSNGYVYNKRVPFYSSGGSLNSGAIATSGVHVEIKDKTSTKIHFLIEGTYRNLEGKVIPVLELLYYDLTLNKGMMLLPEPEHSHLLKIFRDLAAKF
ncbi:MAG: hypothetical protein Q8S11_08345 [Daejeonella sp.]|uniref:hypothetical protein n=1 Tax=Daejeonella sp. TaxID=2805397 RepID=UPI00273303ED|nr:hypothetical protein [Daejeonella sp.]MDP3468330.1 hypothetical protein [Daejeonella sp.]